MARASNAIPLWKCRKVYDYFLNHKENSNKVIGEKFDLKPATVSAILDRYLNKKTNPSKGDNK